MYRNHHLKAGFTLIEIIVIMVIAAILGSMLLPFFGNSFTRSTTTLVNTRSHQSLIKTIERISADYHVLMTADPTGGLATLKANIEGDTYGTYTAETKYIAFDSATQIEKPGSEGDSVLKVKLTQDGQRITALFTK